MNTSHAVRSRFTEQQYVRGMERLVDVVQELSLARDLPTIQRIVRTAARELTGADGATFVLRDNGHCFYADEDAIDPLWKGMRFPMEICISGWVMFNRQSTVIEDIYQDARVPTAAYRPTFVKSLAMVPIRTVDPIGAIGNYWATPYRPGEHEIALLQALADTTAVAMENVGVYAELEERVQRRTAELEAANEEIARLSLTDELTSIYNRRGFYLLADQQRAVAASAGRSFFVMTLDLDGLKERNDTLGHHSGDTLLRDFAHVLRRTFTEPAIVARQGGDEFCVFGLCEHLDADTVLQRLQTAIDAWNTENPAPLPMSASAGVCVHTAARPGSTLDELLAGADRLMYENKRARKRADVAIG